MRITHIEYIRVFIPWQRSFKEPMRAWRALPDTTPEEEDAYVIVKVHTDERAGRHRRGQPRPGPDPPAG